MSAMRLKPQISDTGQMPEQTSTFALQPAVLRRTILDGNVTRHPESHFLDFDIDGEALSSRLTCSIDLVTPLNRAWLSSVPEAVDELLGRRRSAGLADGRVALLVCGCCGDLGCGAVTAAVELRPESVRWADFRWENTYADPSPVPDAPDTVLFRRDEYEAALRGAYQRIAELPYDKLAHEGRRFLWPWQWGWRLPPSP